MLRRPPRRAGRPWASRGRRTHSVRRSNEGECGLMSAREDHLLSIAETPSDVPFHLVQRAGGKRPKRDPHAGDPENALDTRRSVTRGTRRAYANRSSPSSMKTRRSESKVHGFRDLISLQPPRSYVRRTALSKSQRALLKNALPESRADQSPTCNYHYRPVSGYGGDSRVKRRSSSSRSLQNRWRLASRCACVPILGSLFASQKARSSLGAVLRRRPGASPCSGCEYKCQSALEWDPPYCLICGCYPDGVIAYDDPMSIDRQRHVALPACSTRGAGADRALHSPSRPQPRAMGQRSWRRQTPPERPVFGSPESKCQTPSGTAPFAS
ncbi:hypothetical protein AB7M56_000386 [Bradyrhizobium elkanii]|nr:hypothetical protein [Bradyrhizobium elkanii]MCS4070140.1 hypothetical protein [Bradyrhizobium elkanii]MCS4076771.1 hypothetical protein [Bradyrhizobium elkanii]MDH6688373.1 hypothetical protein [Bradyrhizobium elkanii]